jgi:uncharacterized LabA/DUF88 family protein
MNLLAQALIDGAYLRRRAEEFGTSLVNPWLQALSILKQHPIATLCFAPTAEYTVRLARVRYYDGWPEGQPQADATLEAYWNAVELLPDTHLGFGSVVGRPKRQKAVDNLLTVDMLTGAFDRLFQVALLVAGDADYVPAVEEVRRRGVWVAVAAVEGHFADTLRRAADRVVPIGPRTEAGWHTSLNGSEFRPPAPEIVRASS